MYLEFFHPQRHQQRQSYDKYEYFFVKSHPRNPEFISCKHPEESSKRQEYDEYPHRGIKYSNPSNDSDDRGKHRENASTYKKIT